jgi:hypothetical protein
MKSIFPDKFLKLVLLTSIWVNISEVFRYFVIVRPIMQEHLSAIPNVLPMDWGIFSIWGVWDTILTIGIVFIAWLCNQVYGKSTRTIIIAGTTSWAMFFLLFWVGLVNMTLSKIGLLAYTLPLSWIETTVGAWITIKLLEKK